MENEKKKEGRCNHGPRYTATAVLSWSQTLSCCRRRGSVHGKIAIPVPAGTPEGER